MKRTEALIAAIALMAVSLPTWAQGETAPTEGGQPSGGLPQFDPHWWPGQILWLAICFIVLYTLMSKMVLPSIGGTLETRRRKVESDIAAAERLKAEADAAHESYEASLQNARAEASLIVTSLHDKLKSQAENQAKDFRATMEREMAALETRLAKVKDAAMADMNTIAAEIASEAAQKIVGISFDPAKARNVVEALNRREAA